MVPCSSSYCDRTNSCATQTDPCPYKVEYLTPNLSTSGVLVRDVLHLMTTEETKQKVVNANITFGYVCMQRLVQIFISLLLKILHSIYRDSSHMLVSKIKSCICQYVYMLLITFHV